MSRTGLQEEILRRVELLSPALQARVLAFIEDLEPGKKKQGVPLDYLLGFHGTMSPEDAGEMSRAIEEGCETIDAGEW